MGAVEEISSHKGFKPAEGGPVNESEAQQVKRKLYMILTQFNAPDDLKAEIREMDGDTAKGLLDSLSENDLNPDRGDMEDAVMCTIGGDEEKGREAVKKMTDDDLRTQYLIRVLDISSPTPR